MLIVLNLRYTGIKLLVYYTCPRNSSKATIIATVIIKTHDAKPTKLST